MSYAIVLPSAGLGIAVSGVRYLSLPAALAGATPAFPYLLDLTQRLLPSAARRRTFALGARRAICSVEQRRGEEERGEEGLAAWIARTALSAFMTPAV